jgi:hypothetical protein
MSHKTAFPLNSRATTDSFEATTPLEEEAATDVSADSLFEHFAWLYIFCREKLFRDDTARMIRSVWPSGKPNPGEKLIELGCGPGF